MREMLIKLTLFFILLMIVINSTNAINYSVCRSNSNCVFKARDTLSLKRCGKLRNWYKNAAATADSKVIISTRSGISVNNRDYFDMDEDDEEFDNLIILNLNSTDSGRKIYTNAYSRTNNCSFNIFVYDLDNFGGMLTIGEKLFELNQDEKTIHFQIDSFKVPLEYSFNIESLPLDSLLVNDKPVVSSDSCNQKKYPWLNCLQSEKLKLALTKCINEYSLTIAYNVNDEKVYFDEEIDLLKRKFLHNIRLIHPPKVKNELFEITYHKNDSSIEFKCQVECGQTNDMKYIWFVNSLNESNIIQNETESVLTIYNLSYDFSKIDAIYCKLNNSLSYSNNIFERESITTFHIGTSESYHRKKTKSRCKNSAQSIKK